MPCAYCALHGLAAVLLLCREWEHGLSWVFKRDSFKVKGRNKSKKDMEDLLKWYETLSLTSLQNIDQYYTEDCHFRDPFNDTHTRDELMHLFEELFRLDSPRFFILDSLRQDQKAFLSWDFHFRVFGKNQVIHGGSLLCFAGDGRILKQRDYWDVSEELYEKIPGVGSIIRLFKRLL